MTSQRRPAPSRWTPVLMIGTLAALTIWGKLRFVSQAPRTAYAEPRQIDSSLPDLDEPGELVDVVRPEEILEDQAEAFSDVR